MLHQQDSDHPGHRDPGGLPGDAERGMLGDYHPHHLPRGEAQGLEHGQVLHLHQDPPARGVADREQGPAQGDDPEQRQQEPEQRVPAVDRPLHVAPGGNADDRAAGKLGHGLLYHEPGIRRVREPQAHHLDGMPVHGLDRLDQARQGPHEPRRLVGVQALVRGVGDADHRSPDGIAVQALDRHRGPDGGMDGLRKRGFEYDSPRARGRQPAPLADQGAADGGRDRPHGPELHRRCLRPAHYGRGRGLVRPGELLHADQA